MLSENSKRYLAKAMALAHEDGHELLVLNFNRMPDEGDCPIEVLCAMTDVSPESVALMAREALGLFAQPNSIIN